MPDLPDLHARVRLHDTVDPARSTWPTTPGTVIGHGFITRPPHSVDTSDVQPVVIVLWDDDRLIGTAHPDNLANA
jgi:hypothetical protein